VLLSSSQLVHDIYAFLSLPQVSLSAHPETVDEAVQDLGKKHVTYGVASHHVPVMKQVRTPFEAGQVPYLTLVP
jgi:hypothetical protein